MHRGKKVLGRQARSAVVLITMCTQLFLFLATVESQRVSAGRTRPGGASVDIDILETCNVHIRSMYIVVSQKFVFEKKSVRVRTLSLQTTDL